jgi:hypothetical protein
MATNSPSSCLSLPSAGITVYTTTPRLS